ncbi:MAG: 23S rRNA (uracil(1939)-C(5))-methyltransferase RlmD [Lachnospiraceae bacterium]|nr:23S rRNA (uracil(1939)-C(5))-methyltransferase RlmD [Lachnospiraceae bacterium]
MQRHNFQKGMELELFIEDMSVEGEGIGKAEGAIFFVKDAVLEDRVLVKIMKMKKNYGYARLLKVLHPSPYRVEPACPYHRQCGGCQLQALDYHQQLKFKENKVRNHLQRIGGLEVILHPIIGMEEPYHYRNKAQFPIGTDKEGRIITGFYGARSHNIISNRRCLLGTEINEQILNRVIDFMEENQVLAYQEDTGEGLVRHVLIRSGFTTGEIMVCLVINGRRLPFAEKLVEKLRELKGMTSIVLNINEKNTNVILGEKIVNLWGENFITDYIGDIKYQISPLSFFQVNPIQTKKLYETVMNYAGLTGKEIVWDLYCGIGTISLFLAQQAKQVYGIEIVEPAIRDARENARINGIENAAFFVGKAEEVLPDSYERERAKELLSETGLESENPAAGQEQHRALHPDVIVVDPPRKGCDAKCLETIVKMKPERIVYVSCDSATLARDLKYLCENGYEGKEAQPVDMFGQTVHTEVVMRIQRKHV